MIATAALYRLRFVLFAVLALVALWGVPDLSRAEEAASTATSAHSAITPEPKGARWMERHEKFNARVQQGNVDLIFIGDSITHGWEGEGKNVWDRYYGHRNAVNLGIGGDRTQHVLWRLDHGNVDGIRPKVAVVMIGTNNSGKRNTAAEIVDGVTAVVRKLREKLPRTKILLLDIFPRGEHFNEQRGQILQVNQALRRLDDGAFVIFLPIGNHFVEADGSLSKEVMPDFLHLSEKGYGIWATAIEPTLASLLGDDVTGEDYMGLVRRYADTLIEHCRDTYGSEHSPLFGVTLDRRTLKPFDEAGRRMLFEIRLADWENWGIRNGDRCFSGSNVMHDQDLFQVLYALTELTGEKRYAAEADRTLAWFFNNCQSPETGLLAWGEHIAWDFFTEQVSSNRGEQNPIHEFAEPWMLWERSFDLAEDACIRYAKGLWEHQIGDHATGDFSRHAGYKWHETGTGTGFPRHGGFYIPVWATAYERTAAPVFLKAIETLLGHFERTAHPETGAIPCCWNERDKTILWSDSNLSLAIDLWDASEHVPARLRDRMRERALRTDQVYLSLPHDLSPEGRGFVCRANTETLQEHEIDKPTMSDLWATSYGSPSDAPLALLCYTRYQQVQHPGLRKLVLQAAARYFISEPEQVEGLHPVTLGEVITLLMVAADLKEDPRYLDRADHFARKSIELFLRDGPLPAVTPRYRHYESISGADTLMKSLLELWQRRNRPDAKLDLPHSIR
jgi:beta-glucosidase